MTQKNSPQTNDIIFYSSPNGDVRVEVFFQEETFWLNQKRMAELFAVDVRTVNEHLQNIYKTNELVMGATIRNFRIVQTEGTREVSREVDFYNLNAIIAEQKLSVILTMVLLKTKFLFYSNAKTRHQI